MSKGEIHLKINCPVENHLSEAELKLVLADLIVALYEMGYIIEENSCKLVE